MLKYLLLISFLSPSLSYSQDEDEYDDLTIEEFEDSEEIEIEEAQTQLEEENDNSEDKTTKKDVDINESASKEDSENIDVIDLNNMNFEEKESQWSSRNEADEDSEGMSIIDEIIENTEDYSYAGFKRPDPFKEPNISDLKKAYMIQEARFKNAPEALVDENGREIPMVSPLQYHELYKLKLKGIWINSKGDPRAMILTPRNEGVIIKKGDPISAGKVLEIDQEKVLVRQYQVQADGTRTYKDLGLYLKPVEDNMGGRIVFEAGKDVQFIENEKPTTALLNVHKINEEQETNLDSPKSVDDFSFEGGLKPTSTQIIDTSKQKVEDAEAPAASIENNQSASPTEEIQTTNGSL